MTIYEKDSRIPSKRIDDAFQRLRPTVPRHESSCRKRKESGLPRRHLMKMKVSIIGSKARTRRHHL